jgi:alpha/beta superfamily hydrolase
MKIPAPHGQLEVRLREPDGSPRGAAVVCHPHPLHGGTLHTKAVYRAAQAMNDAGLVALRFNFRGVGASTGSYDEGYGERDDVGTALDWLEGEYPDLPKVVGGFSFGSMVALGFGVDDPRPVAFLGMGLPVEMYDFSFLKDAGRPLLVVQGREDEFGPGARVAEVLEGLGEHVSLVTVAGAGHLFDGHFDELRKAIQEYFSDGPGGVALDRALAGEASRA